MVNYPKISLCKHNDACVEMIHASKKVWLSTDWHAIKFNKETTEITKRAEYDAIQKACSVIKPEDCWIYLGDLMDSEIESHRELDELLDCVNTQNRILILGNNDRFPGRDYEKWFQQVMNTVLLPEERVVITHIPIINDERINIHGHLHATKRGVEPGYTRTSFFWSKDGYGVPFKNHVNIYTYPHVPVLLSVAMKRKPEVFWDDPIGRIKPYTRDLLDAETRDYRILRKHYDRLGGA